MGISLGPEGLPSNCLPGGKAYGKPLNRTAPLSALPESERRMCLAALVPELRGGTLGDRRVDSLVQRGAAAASPGLSEATRTSGATRSAGGLILGENYRSLTPAASPARNSPRNGPLAERRGVSRLCDLVTLGIAQSRDVEEWVSVPAAGFAAVGTKEKLQPGSIYKLPQTILLWYIETSLPNRIQM